MESAKTINFDDSSKFVLFSDLHRGNGGKADAFLPNAELFLASLQNYVRRGFTYVEVGDGEESENLAFGASGPIEHGSSLIELDHQVRQHGEGITA